MLSCSMKGRSLLCTENDEACWGVRAGGTEQPAQARTSNRRATGSTAVGCRAGGVLPREQRTASRKRRRGPGSSKADRQRGRPVAVQFSCFTGNFRQTEGRRESEGGGRSRRPNAPDADRRSAGTDGPFPFHRR